MIRNSSKFDVSFLRAVNGFLVLWFVYRWDLVCEVRAKVSQPDTDHRVNDQRDTDQRDTESALKVVNFGSDGSDPEPIIVLFVAHGDVLQILQTKFINVPCWRHRQAVRHMEPGELREVHFVETQT